jgi:BlaI family transcriptional regulator, penicillinase repressor
MNFSQRISDSEWQVMRVIWERHPIPGSEVITALGEKDRGWHPKTVRTLLGRLVKKRAIKAEQQGRGNVYTPLVTERECLANASESFLDRFFGGSLKPMLAYFAEQKRLTSSDLAELRKILEDKKPQKGSKK